ncbi:hypothetical protein PspLS_10022 [Pyricularia sp. CBS 133598]|nr:hypothetical protein PspLS_10022 [Pyricularia sp. CBS 133598]
MEEVATTIGRRRASYGLPVHGIKHELPLRLLVRFALLLDGPFLKRRRAILPTRRRSLHLVGPAELGIGGGRGAGRSSSNGLELVDVVGRHDASLVETTIDGREYVLQVVALQWQIRHLIPVAIVGVLPPVTQILGPAEGPAHVAFSQRAVEGVVRTIQRLEDVGVIPMLVRPGSVRGRGRGLMMLARDDDVEYRLEMHKRSLQQHISSLNIMSASAKSGLVASVACRYPCARNGSFHFIRRTMRKYRDSSDSARGASFWLTVRGMTDDVFGLGTWIPEFSAGRGLSGGGGDLIGVSTAAGCRLSVGGAG